MIRMHTNASRIIVYDAHRLHAMHDTNPVFILTHMVCVAQTNPNYGFYTTPFERMNAILDQGITVFYALQVGLVAGLHDTSHVQLWLSTR